MIRDPWRSGPQSGLSRGDGGKPPRMEEDHPKWPKWWTPLGEYMGVSLKGDPPHFTPQSLIILEVGKPSGFVGETHQLRKPPYSCWVIQYMHPIGVIIYIYICIYHRSTTKKREPGKQPLKQSRTIPKSKNLKKAYARWSNRPSIFGWEIFETSTSAKLLVWGPTRAMGFWFK